MSKYENIPLGAVAEHKKIGNYSHLDRVETAEEDK